MKYEIAAALFVSLWTSSMGISCYNGNLNVKTSTACVFSMQ